MRPTICFLVLIFTISSEGFDVVRVGGRIYLESPSCAEVVEVATSLDQWTHQQNSSKICPISKNEKTGDLCRLDISDCVPDHVAKYQSIQPKLGGPNCWNLALVMKGIIPALRNSTADEMSFFMASPLCRQLASDEKPKAGDVGSIRNKNGSTPDDIEVHGFIYISDQIVYSKAGSRPWNEPFSLLPYKEILTTFSNSNRTTTFFRCSSMEEYLTAHSDVPPQLLATFSGLNKFERCLEPQSISGTPLTSIAKGEIRDVATALTQYLEAEVKKNTHLGIKNEEVDFLIGSLQIRLTAIANHLGVTSVDSSLSPELLDLVQSIKKYSNILSPK